jgi:hypothetical protein
VGELNEWIERVAQELDETFRLPGEPAWDETDELHHAMMTQAAWAVLNFAVRDTDAREWLYQELEKDNV